MHCRLSDYLETFLNEGFRITSWSESLPETSHHVIQHPPVSFHWVCVVELHGMYHCVACGDCGRALTGGN